MAAVPFVCDLVAICPELRVLVTSRTRLGLSGERIYRVSPLAVPSNRVETAPEDIARSPAAQLFIERARAVQSNFALTADSASVVAAICRQLDGLPLAIELAAAWVRVLPDDVLLARLERRLALLTGGPSDQPPRLQMMRDAIAWSYDLLREEEQQLLRRLSIFAGGFTLAAVEAVGNGLARAPVTVLERLTSLVDKSLVQQREDLDAAPRYGMLEVIREFALERLEERGETDIAYDRALSWYLTRARAAGWRWDVPRDQKDREWFAAWDRELNTVRAVLAWAEARGEIERALQLASSLFLFWWARDHLHEGRRWLEQGLAVGTGATPWVRAQALSVLSAITHRLDDNAYAAQLAREALVISSEIGDQESSAHAAYLLAIALYRQGDLDAAEQRYNEALTLWGAAGQDVLSGEAQLGLAQIARDRGELERAAALYEETLHWQTATGVDWGAALCRYGYATVNQAQGDVAQALTLYRESLRYWRQIGDDGSVAVCLEGIASALCYAGMAEQAVRLLAAAQALRDAIDFPHPCNALASYGGLVSSVHGSLSEDTFTRAWLAGLRLSIDEAIAEATLLYPNPTRPQRGAVVQYSRDLPGLTPREREVLGLVVRGHSDREIAATLFISRRTASEHVGKILQKLDAKSRADATAIAVRSGLI